MHHRRFGKATRATYESLDPGAQIAVLAFDLLRMLLAHVMLFRVDMALVGPPPIGGKARDAKRLSQCLQLEKPLILPSPKNGGSHGPTGVIDGMP